LSLSSVSLLSSIPLEALGLMSTTHGVGQRESRLL
jgi:hypothetical protein